MRMTDIIAKKRDRKELSNEEIQFFVLAAAKETVPDYQLSALLMAIYLNGMSEKEIAELALCMSKSGDVLDLSTLGQHTVDKHSTGGVGDKTTLICAPLAAAMGCTVAKMSGRGLGHTGGTVDKLEAIIGYNTAPDRKLFFETARKTGLCLAGHSGNFAPADKKLYSLRDVTSTVESIPLIASSIMSKKIASGAKNIVLDVKFGSGAFMKSPQEAERLATEMVRIGKNVGLNTIAVITDMDIPLGKAVGNALEVKEACEILNNCGDNRLRELSVTLAAAMHCACFGTKFEESLNLAEEKLADKSALNKLCDTVAALGGDTSLLTGEKNFPNSQSQRTVRAKSSGYISSVNSFLVGKAACICGAGRETLTDTIDLSAGIVFDKQYGDYVNQGEPIATLYGKEKKLCEAEEILNKTFAIEEQKPENRNLIYKIIKEV